MDSSRVRRSDKRKQKFTFEPFGAEEPLGDIPPLPPKPSVIRRMIKIDDKLIIEVLSIVEEIPVGKVASYGQIARLAGLDGYSRMVARIMGMSSMYGDFPKYRVVTADGRCAPGWPEQKDMLKDDGVQFLKNGHVDMAKFRWDA